jgi:uncharacterized protein (DUF1015 family)
MPVIKAFDGYLVNPERAHDIVSPAYDSVSPEQRRQFAEAHPENFINTMRLQEDYPANAQPSQEQLLATNKERLQQLLANGSFNSLTEPCMFVYRLGAGKHIQTGVVCEVAVDDYERGLLRKHENTRSSKEDLLAQYQEVVGASSSPICLTYSRDAAIDDFIDHVTSGAPTLDFQTDDGETQTIWCISDPHQLAQLQSLFANVHETYLTDGHHRAASGRRYAEIMREKTNSNNGDEPYNQLLVALFPDNQLNLLPFHRCVKDLNGLSSEQVLTALAKDFDIEPLVQTNAFEPGRHGEFGMLLKDSWYKLTLKADRVDQANPVDSLDVSILQNLILDRVLGIGDARDDSRLGYIAGIGGDKAIKQTVSEGWDAVFTCFATSIKQLMSVADADQLMPPKSTYFDPKPRSGIFVRLK